MKPFPLILGTALFAALIFSSCHNGPTLAADTFTESYAQVLVDDYNSKLLDDYDGFVPDIMKGLALRGTITTEKIAQWHGEVFDLTFTHQDPKKNYTFSFAFDDDVPLPQEMSNVFVVFLGKQLIIHDITHREVYNLWVNDEGVENKLAALPTYTGASLGIRYVALNKVAGGCDCVCVPCAGDDCGMASCSCESMQQKSCFVACRTGIQASCNDTALLASKM